MPALERDDIERALARKGFRSVDKGRDHRFYRFYHDEKYTGIYTKVSRGSSKKYKTISRQLTGVMARQLKITSPQFTKLVECPMSEEDYAEHLRNSGEL